MTADITLRGPDDVLAVLPYQLGYHPRDSVVVVSMHEREIALVLRSDLPPEQCVAEVSSSLVGPVLREGAGSAIVVGFEEVEHASMPLLLAVVEGLESCGVEVLDVQVVREGRRYSPVCVDDCCPAEGTAVPGPEAVPAVAEFVLRGRSPLTDRHEVDALVEADPGDSQGVADAVARRLTRPGRVTDRRRRSARAWCLLLREPAPPPDPAHLGLGFDRAMPALAPDVVADLATGLSDVPWRDGVISWLAPGLLPVELLDAHVVGRLRRTMPRWADMGAGFDREPAAGPLRHRPSGPSEGLRRTGEREDLHQRLLRLCRSVTDANPDEAAALCTLTAAVCWADGDGAVARAAIERGVRLRPDYRLALLLRRTIDQGVRVGSRPDGRRPGEMGLAG